MTKVVDVWNKTPPESQWRVWKTSHRDLNLHVECNLNTWKEITSLRNIHSEEGQEILCWGHSMTGTFTIKEAYHLKSQFQLLPKYPIWHIIWKSNLWPKVSTFLWLLEQNRSLSWDNLRKKGFIGPSTCPLCMQQEESLDNLMNQCPFSLEL
jgi:hypothetical protein